MAQSGCVENRTMSSKNPPLRDESDWSLSLIKDIVNNDSRIVFKEIVSIERKSPTELRVTTGRLGFLSGAGQWITLNYLQGVWSVSKIESFDS
jgi:hypothetical protein